MSYLENLFDKWWTKSNTTVATPIVFKCYRAGYYNAIKHVILILTLLAGVLYVVT
jgi:hypothetical protein